MSGDISHYERLVTGSDKNFADLTFIINPGKITIAAHMAIVTLRCENLTKKAVKKVNKKKGGSTVEVKEGAITSETLTTLLLWVYTGDVDFSKLNQTQILKLNGAAKLYEIDRLQWACETYLRETLTMENAFTLLKGAQELKDTNVKEFCLAHAQENYKDFITNKEGPKTLGIELFQEVVATVASNQDKPSKVTILPEPKNTVLSDYSSLYESQNLSDVTLNVDGTAIHCHSAIVACYSRELAALMMEVTRSKKDYPIGNISPSAFHAVLKFIYYGDVKVDPLDATLIIAFSKKYGLPVLQEICEKKIGRSIENSTVIEILRVAYSGEMKEDTEDLKKNALKHIAQNLADVDITPLKQEHMPKQLPLDILMACQREVKGGGAAASGGSSSQIKRKEKKKDKKKASGPTADLPPPILDTPAGGVPPGLMTPPPDLKTPPVAKKN